MGHGGAGDGGGGADEGDSERGLQVAVRALQYLLSQPSPSALALDEVEAD